MREVTYFLWAIYHGVVKIGRTRHLYARCETIAKGANTRLLLLGVTSKSESWLHDQFHYLRLDWVPSSYQGRTCPGWDSFRAGVRGYQCGKTEWFMMAPELIQEINHLALPIRPSLFSGERLEYRRV